MAATPPMEPTTTPAIAPPLRPELSSDDDSDVDVAVGSEFGTVIVLILPPLVVSTAVLPVLVVLVSSVELSELFEDLDVVELDGAVAVPDGLWPANLIYPNSPSVVLPQLSEG